MAIEDNVTQTSQGKAALYFVGFPVTQLRSATESPRAVDSFVVYYLSESLSSGYMHWSHLEEYPNLSHLSSKEGIGIDELKNNIVLELLSGTIPMDRAVASIKEGMRLGLVRAEHFEGVDDFTRNIIGLTDTETQRELTVLG